MNKKHANGKKQNLNIRTQNLIWYAFGGSIC